MKKLTLKQIHYGLKKEAVLVQETDGAAGLMKRKTISGEVVLLISWLLKIILKMQKVIQKMLKLTTKSGIITYGILDQILTTTAKLLLKITKCLLQWKSKFLRTRVYYLLLHFLRFKLENGQSMIIFSMIINLLL